MKDFVEDGHGTAGAWCRGYRGKQPFDRDQVAFVAQCVLEGARMLIEDGLPTSITYEERAKAWGEDRVPCLNPYERGALEGAGAALSILFAQLTGEGMGGGDALVCADDFHEAIERMMEKSWQDRGAAVTRAVRLRAGVYKIEEIIPGWPDCRRHAAHFADVVLDALQEGQQDGRQESGQDSGQDSV